MRIVAVVVFALILTGCNVKVPAKFRVTDFASGKEFTTYADWGYESMLGYSFMEADSGDRVMLKSYQIKTLAPGGYFKPNSPQVVEFLEDRSRWEKQVEVPRRRD